MTNTPRPDRAFLGTAALVFAASTAVTIAWCSSMSAMPDMEMPGGWTMSMTWMRMPGQTWIGASATFLGMWTVMMVAMMLPVLTPVLSRYRAALGDSASLNTQTALVAAGYFTVWLLFGAAAYPLGVALAALTMRLPELSRGIPFATGVVMLIAGALQFTRVKARQLARCRQSPDCCGGPRAGRNAWNAGLRFGIQCVSCCLGSTAVLFVIGVMDLRAMTLITVAICAERLLSAGERVARIVGTGFIATGLVLIQQA